MDWLVDWFIDGLIDMPVGWMAEGLVDVLNACLMSDYTHGMLAASLFFCLLIRLLRDQ